MVPEWHCLWTGTRPFNWRARILGVCLATNMFSSRLNRKRTLASAAILIRVICARKPLLIRWPRTCIWTSWSVPPFHPQLPWYCCLMPWYYCLILNHSLTHLLFTRINSTTLVKKTCLIGCGKPTALIHPIARGATFTATSPGKKVRRFLQCMHLYKLISCIMWIHAIT